MQDNCTRWNLIRFPPAEILSNRDFVWKNLEKLTSTWSLNYGIIYLVHTQNIPKNKHFLSPDTNKYVCAYQRVRNVSFSDYFVHILNEWSLNAYVIWDLYGYSKQSYKVVNKFSPDSYKVLLHLGELGPIFLHYFPIP